MSSRRRYRFYRNCRLISFSSHIISDLVLGFLSITIGLIGGIGLIIYNTIKGIYNLAYYRKHKFTYLQLYNFINKLDGRTFEVFMYNVFKANGYKSYLTEASCDGGKDIILWIDNQKTYVELKRWGGNWHVGRPELQKLIGTCEGDSIHNAIFITTGEYTKEAVQYANKVPYLKLMDMKDVINLCENISDKMPYILSKTKLITINKVQQSVDIFNERIEKKTRNLELKSKYY